MEEKLVEHVEKFHTTRLPAIISELTQEIEKAGEVSGRVSDIAQQLANFLRDDPQLPASLELTRPSSLWKANKWDGDQVLQRRVQAAKRTVECLTQLIAQDNGVERVSQKLLAYRMSLGMFEVRSRFGVPCCFIEN